VCVEVFKKLARSVGRNPDQGLEELLASVVRSINAMKGNSGAMSKDLVISIGDFVYNQLIGLDDSSSRDDEKFVTLPVLLALRDQCKSRVKSIGLPSDISNASLKIKESEYEEITEDDDGKLAMLLQQKED
jgi:DNA (cytosine-5)-methyltransferase 1